MQSQKPRVVRSEHVEQRNFVSWWRKTYRNDLLYSIPNGGKRSASEAMRLRVEGVVKGMPDLHSPPFRLWIEFKRTKGGRLEDHQVKMHDYLTSIGDTVIVAYGCEDAMTKVKAFMEEKCKS